MSRRGIISGLLCGLVLFASGFVTLAGEWDSKQKDWIEKYKKQDNAPDPAKMLLNEAEEPELNNGFKSLFNGKVLAGWVARGGDCKFDVKDECIVGTCVPGSPSTYLSTGKNYTDFVFSCEMKWEVDCNSGVMFRAQIREDKGKEVVFGPQAEMEGFSKDRGWSGGIYGQSCGGFFYPLWLVEHREARKALKEGWNRLTVSAKGNVVRTWVNGVPAAHWVDDGSYAEGFFGLQIHKGSEGTVLWKNLRIKELAK